MSLRACQPPLVWIKVKIINLKADEVQERERERQIFTQHKVSRVEVEVLVLVFGYGYASLWWDCGCGLVTLFGFGN